MASNDMQVLMYKILKYLYECMKNGIEPKLEDFSWDSKLMDVPQSYWLSGGAEISPSENKIQN